MEGTRLARVIDRLAVHAAAGRPLGSALCATCVDVLDVPGAGIMVHAGAVHRGALSVSDDVMAALEDLEFTLGEGPCVDAYKLGIPVAEPDLAAPTNPRWLAFSSLAVAAGARAMFGFPMGIGSARIGSLNLYADKPGPLADDQHQDALVLADVATYAVLSVQADEPDDVLVAELLDIGSHQLRVHQATGMVSVQIDKPMPEALARLRAHAFAEGRTVSDVAADVVARRLRFEP